MITWFVYWLGTAPGWQLGVAVVAAVLLLQVWLKYLDSIIPKGNDQHQNFNYEIRERFA